MNRREILLLVVQFGIVALVFGLLYLEMTGAFEQVKTWCTVRNGSLTMYKEQMVCRFPNGSLKTIPVSAYE